ncbi:MAG TPA: 2-phosphosulfolactate phosphatase [Clostridiaceae bacterium]|nr:2-phosphosulfolactate phosphatase [Clostridiaceae bacterium]
MRIDIIISAEQVNSDQVKTNTVIVVDTLRATSTIITALSNGAKSVVPVATVEEALHIRKQYEHAVLGGERRSVKIEGFDYSNSPREYTNIEIHGTNIILTTTNGTKAISRSREGKRILIGALLNAKAVAGKAFECGDDIVIVNAGTNGRFSMDDFITGGAIISELMDLGPLELSDIAKTALLIYRSYKDIRSYIKEAAHYKSLEELGLQEDIDFCLQKDIFDIVPEYSDGVIKTGTAHLPEKLVI